MKIIDIEKFNCEELKTEIELMNKGTRIFKFDENKVFKRMGINKYVLYNPYDYATPNVKNIMKYEDELSKEIPEIVLPIELVRQEGDVIGFTMKKIKGQTLLMYLKNPKYSIDKKIYYLEYIGKILNKLKGFRNKHNLKNFFINDLHEENFLVGDDGILYVVDIDSFSIHGKMTNPAKMLICEFDYSGTEKKSINPLDINIKKYKYYNFTSPFIGYITANKNTDMYCYYIVILNFLYGENIVDYFSPKEYNGYINYLEKLGLDKNLIDCFKNINEPSDNINPASYIKSIKEIYKVSGRKYYENYKRKYKR